MDHTNGRRRHTPVKRTLKTSHVPVELSLPQKFLLQHNNFLSFRNHVVEEITISSKKNSLEHHPYTDQSHRSVFFPLQKFNIFTQLWRKSIAGGRSLGDEW